MNIKSKQLHSFSIVVKAKKILKTVGKMEKKGYCLENQYSVVHMGDTKKKCDGQLLTFVKSKLEVPVPEVDVETEV